jgi:hypothetical protein
MPRVWLSLRTMIFSTRRLPQIFSLATCLLALKAFRLSALLLKVRRPRELNPHFCTVQVSTLIHPICPHLRPRRLELRDRVLFRRYIAHRHQGPALLHCARRRHAKLLKRAQQVQRQKTKEFKWFLKCERGCEISSKRSILVFLDYA